MTTSTRDLHVVVDPLEANIDLIWQTALDTATIAFRDGRPGWARYVLARAGLTIQNALDRAGVA